MANAFRKPDSDITKELNLNPEEAHAKQSTEFMPE